MSNVSEIWKVVEEKKWRPPKWSKSLMAKILNSDLGFWGLLNLSYWRQYPPTCVCGAVGNENIVCENKVTFWSPGKYTAFCEEHLIKQYIMDYNGNSYIVKEIYDDWQKIRRLLLLETIKDFSKILE